MFRICSWVDGRLLVAFTGLQLRVTFPLPTLPVVSRGVRLDEEHVPRVMVLSPETTIALRTTSWGLRDSVSAYGRDLSLNFPNEVEGEVMHGVLHALGIIPQTWLYVLYSLLHQDLGYMQQQGFVLESRPISGGEVQVEIGDESDEENADENGELSWYGKVAGDALGE